MTQEQFNVYVDTPTRQFVGSVTQLTEAANVARQACSRMGKVGSVNYVVFDTHNNRRGGGSVYVT